MVNYPIGDFLIRIKNAARAHLKDVSAKYSKEIFAIAKVLKEEGFLESISREEDILKVKVAYRKKAPVLMDLKLVSKPGLRIYAKVTDIEKKKSPSIYLVSTPGGILTSKGAIKKRLGGEIIAEVT